MNKHNYIMVTPAKNEGKNLPELINSVANQSIKPKLWLIIDDGSTDNTSCVIQNATKKYKWIKSISFKESKRDITKHISEITKIGFDYAVGYSKKNNINYDYLTNIDADMILPQDYFDKIFVNFKENQKLGVASGSVYYKKGKISILEKTSPNLPRGGLMVWSKKCFEQIRGIPLVDYSWDSVSNTRAILGGWETKCYKNILIMQSRKTSSAEGLWKGYILNGKSSYYLNFNPIHIILKSLKLSFKKPYYIGFAFFLGYLNNLLTFSPKIQDKEIKKYYWKTRFKEALKWNVKGK